MAKFAGILILLCISLTACYITNELYEEIKAKAPWEVLELEKVREIFKGQTYESNSVHGGKNHLVDENTIKEMSFKKTFLAEESISFAQFPPHFNWVERAPTCFRPIKHQGTCGCCYAFASTSALEQRICIASGGKINPELSAQDVLSCDAGNGKCKGDYINNTWGFLEKYGACNLSCKPYQSMGGQFIPQCIQGCANGEQYRTWKARGGSYVHLNNPEQIKNQLMNYGPMTAVIQTFEDLSTFKGNGVYVHVAGRETDHHIVNVVGWTTDQQWGECWIFRNSWGADWGNGGYFKVPFNRHESNNHISASFPLL